MSNLRGERFGVLFPKQQGLERRGSTSASLDWESIQGNGDNTGKAGEMGRAGHQQGAYGLDTAGEKWWRGRPRRKLLVTLDARCRQLDPRP